MTPTKSPVPLDNQLPQLGRKRDHSRDPEILAVALDILAETGYDGMTMDMVACRAKAGKGTLYRRWSSKDELLIDAVAFMKKDDLDLTKLSDTGTLRGDLVAMIKVGSTGEGEKKLKVMAGLMSMLSRRPELAEAVNAAVVGPRVEAHLVLLQRAVERGEISASCDLTLLSLVLPSMAAYRVLVLRRSVDHTFLMSLIDGVLMPAVGIPSAPR